MARVKTPRTNNSTSKQVITMPEATSTSPLRKNVSPNNPTPIDLEVKIRERAYELYEERGRVTGQENEDWLQAEREVLARYQHQQSA
jgi:Protein of unknown function (DUF2934)